MTTATRTEDRLTPALLDTAQAAAYLSTTDRHIRRLVDERRIAYVKIGRKVRFQTADLDAFIASNRTAARTPSRW